MKINLLPHLAWALIAGVTFIVGSRTASPPEDESGDYAAEPPPALSARKVGRTEREEESRRNSSRSRPARKSEGGGDSQLDPSKVAKLKEAFQTGNLVERRLAFAEILGILTPGNALELRELIADLPENSEEYREFHYAWGAVAGIDAVSHSKETQKKDMAASLAGWASNDPTAAISYFDSLSPEEQNNGAHLKWGAAFGLADADPGLAVEFARLREIAGDKDAPKMIHIASAAILREGDPDQAARWASTIPGGALQNTALEHLAKEYAKDDPAGAVDWAGALPTGEGRDHAMSTSFHQWADRDLRKAADAIAALPTPQDRDSAKYGYATSIMHKDPVAGIEWASNIQDPDQRTRALVDTGRAFYKSDQEAARDWLVGSGFPDEVVQKITKDK